MRFDVVTIFPELFAPHLSHGHHAPRLRVGPGGRAPVAAARLCRRRLPPRRRPPLRRRPGHGDAGRALAACAGRRGAERGGPGRRWCTSRPRADASTRPWCSRWRPGPGAVLLCGRYEGIDQRVIDLHVTHELSLGDFVLSGGELPALALLDAVARLQEGVLTRPRTSRTAFPTACWKARTTAAPKRCRWPGGIWRCRRCCCRATTARSHAGGATSSLELTARRRPDLIAAARAAGRLDKADETLAWLASGYNQRLFDPLPGHSKIPIPQRRDMIARRKP
jgi:tRNA (guanine37-N1)-methyltransferase